jgi:hypothetical protein
MDVFFDFKNDTIRIYNRVVSQESFRAFLIDNYPLLVKKFITKSIIRAGVVQITVGNTKTISSSGNSMFVIDWEYVFSIAQRSGYIITDFIMYLKRQKAWNCGN